MQSEKMRIDPRGKTDDFKKRVKKCSQTNYETKK